VLRRIFTGRQHKYGNEIKRARTSREVVSSPDPRSCRNVSEHTKHDVRHKESSGNVCYHSVQKLLRPVRYLKPYKRLMLPVAVYACGTFPLVCRRYGRRVLDLSGRRRGLIPCRGHIRGENDVQSDAERHAASHLSVTTVCTRALLIALQIVLIYIHPRRCKRALNAVHVISVAYNWILFRFTLHSYEGASHLQCPIR
jgi:hypothetical protein